MTLCDTRSVSWHPKCGLSLSTTGAAEGRVHGQAIQLFQGFHSLQPGQMNDTNQRKINQQRPCQESKSGIASSKTLGNSGPNNSIDHPRHMDTAIVTAKASEQTQYQHNVTKTSKK